MGSKAKHRFRYETIFLLLKLFNLLVLFLPLKLSLYLGKLLGNLAYLVLRQHRQKTIANLKFALQGERNTRQIKIIAKGVFQNLGKNLIEVLSFPKINSANIDRLVTVHGLEKIDEILKNGCGCLVVTAHLGNWELMAAYFALKGYPSYVIARHLRFDKYNQMLCSLRESKGVIIIDRQASPRSILEILHKNSLLGILPDQDVDSVRGVFVDFFGKSTYTPSGPVSLARAAKIPIVPCFIIRIGDKHHLFVENPIELTLSENKEEDLKKDTQHWSKVVESYIKKYPEQWVWMHQRWKTKP